MKSTQVVLPALKHPPEEVVALLKWVIKLLAEMKIVHQITVLPLKLMAWAINFVNAFLIWPQPQPLIKKDSLNGYLEVNRW
jgi:hypothetical protein